ncbi:SURF1 family protein [Glaciecola sp. MH2013]|uniref:SURF1 family protein n=1 Tax=Glaciecola sp. MH2013 TaxID=2785524 RepID=UPI00189FDD2A|nr:SURF1 family protein [Glaciecola sp. MH2013]MBF7074424.1 SURF1 family protein [Glaciecola sp. MH2013]
MWLRNLPLIPTLITLMCVVIMFGLGLWQLDRKVEKDIRLSQIEERKQNKALSPQELNKLLLQNSLPSKANELQDFPISFTGKSKSQQLFYIDNKIYQGKVGYEIILPVQLDNSNNMLNETFILVNLGWIQGVGPRGSRSKLPSLSASELELLSSPVDIPRPTHGIDHLPESVLIAGVVKYPSNNKMVSETNTRYGIFPAVLQQLNMAEVERHLGIHSEQKLLPYIVNINPNPESSFVRDWQPVVMAPEKHLGYAVQWFGLGIAALTIYLLSVLKLLHSKNNKEDQNARK